MFAAETLGLRADLMSIAKGLCSVYLPIAGVLMTEEIFAAIAKQSGEVGMFALTFTTGGHPTTSAVALRNIELIEERDVLAHVRSISPRFLERLQALTDHPLVGEAHGMGLAGTVELVAGKPGNLPFDEQGRKRIRPVMRDCGRKHGLIPRGFVECQSFAPPLIITGQQIDEMFDRFSRTLDDAAAHLRAEGVIAA